jgi:hypothetical protein
MTALYKTTRISIPAQSGIPTGTGQPKTAPVVTSVCLLISMLQQFRIEDLSSSPSA